MPETIQNPIQILNGKTNFVVLSLKFQFSRFNVTPALEIKEYLTKKATYNLSNSSQKLKLNFELNKTQL